MKKMNTAKLLNYMSAIMFFGFISVIGIISLFFGGAPDTEPPSVKSLTVKTAEEYAAENFPMKKNWTSLYSKTAWLTGQRIFNGVYCDIKNDRLINIFTEPDKEKTAAAVNAVNGFHEKFSDIPTYIMLAPTASGVYRSDMPESAEATDQQKLIDDLYYNISVDIAPLDVFNALYSSRDNSVYFRTEPYWTQLGAYEAYNASASKLGLTPYTLSNYDMDYTHVYYSGALAEKSGLLTVTPDTINAYRCKYGSYVRSTKLIIDKQTYTKTSVYSKNGLRSENKYSYFLGADKFKCAQIETTGKDLPSLLIIKSDYANCFVPFLAPHYSKITLLDPSQLEEKETIYDFADPSDYDQILFLYDVENFCTAQGFEKLS